MFEEAEEDGEAAWLQAYRGRLHDNPEGSRSHMAFVPGTGYDGSRTRGIARGLWAERATVGRRAGWLKDERALLRRRELARLPIDAVPRLLQRLDRRFQVGVPDQQIVRVLRSHDE